METLKAVTRYRIDLGETKLATTLDHGNRLCMGYKVYTWPSCPVSVQYLEGLNSGHILWLASLGKTEDGVYELSGVYKAVLVAVDETHITVDTGGVQHRHELGEAHAKTAVASAGTYMEGKDGEASPVWVSRPNLQQAEQCWRSVNHV